MNFKYSIFDTVEVYSWATGSEYFQYLYFHKLMECKGRVLSEKVYKLQCEVFEQSMLEDMAKAATEDFGKIDTELKTV